MQPLFWLILIVVLAVIELMTTALTTVWFVAGGLVAFILSVFGVPETVQWIAFVVVSVLSLVITRPILMKKLDKNHVKTNAQSLIGKKARVTQKIDNDLAHGVAVVGGQEWTARSSDDSKTIAEDSIVEIVDIRGVKLIVKPIEGEV